MKANRLGCLTALVISARAGSNDSALVNFLSQGSYFNLETDNSHSHPIITEGDGDINIQDGHGDVQMTHGGDIVESNKRGHALSAPPRRHFHIDTDKLRGLTGKPKKKKSKKSKRRKNRNSRKYRNVPRWEEDDYYLDNEDFYDDYDYQSNYSDEEDYYPQQQNDINGYFDMYHQYNPYEDHQTANDDEWREWENDTYYSNSLNNKWGSLSSS